LNIDSVKLVTFSPTGTSKKVAEAMAQAIQAPIELLDLTPPIAKTRDFEEFHDELAIITSPVYCGRVPYEVAYRVRRLIANNTPAVLVVTYGNRAYEDALLELSDIVSEVGFKPIGACAFIGEHSFSIPEMPTAHGRSDVEDLAKAEVFARAAALSTLLVSTDEDACIWCCACVRSCPTGVRVRRPRMLETTEWLNTNLSERKEPETFL
jgi:flavodoxin